MLDFNSPIRTSASLPFRAITSARAVWPFILTKLPTSMAPLSGSIFILEGKSATGSGLSSFLVNLSSSVRACLVVSRSALLSFISRMVFSMR